MITLAIDTATDVLSVALEIETESGRGRLCATRDVGLKHTAGVMRLVDGLVAESGIEPTEIDLVCCMRGPGSFTGLRIGMATAKGLAWSIALKRDLPAPPIVSLPTLDVIASAIPTLSSIMVLPVIDARKKRFYGAGFARGKKVTADLDLPAPELLAIMRDAGKRVEIGADAEILIAGPHASRFCEEILDGHDLVRATPAARLGSALAMIPLAKTLFDSRGPDKLDAGPDYIRLSEAEESMRARRTT